MLKPAASTGLVLACLAAAGCGSGGSPPATTAAASTEASKPPKQILADAASALRSAHGFAMQGTIIQNRQRLRIKLTTTSATSLDVAFSIGNSTAELIGLPSGSYIRGNATFWTSHAGPGAARLADRWIEVPATNARALTASLGALAPATLSRCLVENHGTLSIAGKATVDGRAAILLRDAGNSPGSSPGLLTVAATGAPVPLRYTATGGQRAGGRVDVCNDGKASDARGAIDFSQFGQVAPIQAPKGAVQQPALGPSI